MKITWLGIVFCLSFLLMGTLKSHELNQWQPYFKNQPTWKLSQFEEKRSHLKTTDLELFELWESMLTGRTAPVARWMKEQYKSLGLSHLFTPSGFHLSALLLPVMKLIKWPKAQFLILLCLSAALFSFSGQGALKRMGLVKLAQHWTSKKGGFILALTIDVLVGTFQESALSFTFSFLFLGIIYAGVKWTFSWFFLAQGMIAYFQSDLLSPFLLFLSPLLNIGFGLALPILMLCSYPLTDWQLQLGLELLEGLQSLVSLSAKLCGIIPAWQIHCGFLVIGLLFYLRRKWLVPIALIFFTNELNQDFQKLPGASAYEFVPQGVVNKIKDSKMYFSDGRCERKLVRGLWWEKCSPRRRSTYKRT
jgi:hypothetical protein